MGILSVKDLRKKYTSFELNKVSFELQEGKITGFIGRNGAGKSTTLNSLLNFVHPDGGEVKFFGKDFSENEFEIKQKIGFVSSGVNYYSKKKIKSISKVTKSFYPNWDENEYIKYIKLFNLDENKTPSQLSCGMKLKYALALALSHNAKLLILDEPTSGLDPVSRDELLDVFMELTSFGKTILFSTHITSDLEKCADNVIYIKNGNIIADTNIKAFENSYMIIEYVSEQEREIDNKYLLGKNRDKNGYTGLISSKNIKDVSKECRTARLEEIMLHLEKEG